MVFYFKAMAIKILFITDAIYPGGSYTYLRSFIQEISLDSKIYFDLITFGDCPLPLKYENIKNFNYRHFFVSKKNSLISVFDKSIKLFRYFSKNSSTYDLLITDLINPSFCTLIVKKFFPKIRRIPHLYQFHGSPLLEKKSMGMFNNGFWGRFKYCVHYCFEAFVFRQVTNIIVFSNYSKNLIGKLHHIKKKIIVIKPGVACFLNSKYRRLSKDKARSCLGFDPHIPIFLLVSRIEKRKGIDEFINNFSKIKSKGQLILCSNFDQVHFNVFPVLEKANLGSKLKLINSPTAEQLSLLYRAATVTILPSIMLETFGFVTLESLYFNTPVLAFDIGANPELIENKYLVKYDSKNRWKKLMSKLITLEKFPIEKYSSPLVHSFSWSSYLSKILELTK